MAADSLIEHLIATMNELSQRISEANRHQSEAHMRIEARLSFIENMTRKALAESEARQLEILHLLSVKKEPPHTDVLVVPLEGKVR